MGCVGVMDVAGSGGDGGRGGGYLYIRIKEGVHICLRPVQIHQHPFTFTFICGIYALGLNQAPHVKVVIFLNIKNKILLRYIHYVSDSSKIV